MALACRLFGHKWDKCKCARCGELREILDLHDWNGCVCRMCGAKRDKNHRYQNGTCVICGKKLTKKSLLDVFQPPPFSSFTVHELQQIDPAAQLALAYDTLPPEEADEVLIKAYDTVTRTYGNNPKVDDAVKQIFVPFITEERLLKLYASDSVSMHHLTLQLDRDLILRACEQSGVSGQLEPCAQIYQYIGGAVHQHDAGQPLLLQIQQPQQQPCRQCQQHLRRCPVRDGEEQRAHHQQRCFLYSFQAAPDELPAVERLFDERAQNAGAYECGCAVPARCRTGRPDRHACQAERCEQPPDRPRRNDYFLLRYCAVFAPAVLIQQAYREEQADGRPARRCRPLHAEPLHEQEPQPCRQRQIGDDGP